MVSSPSTPSSSAVTIPIPGRSILKRPPPTNNSLFSRITRFLPNTTGSGSTSTSATSSSNTNASSTLTSGPTSNPSATGTNTKPVDPHSTLLKRAHFILPEIAVVYPISAANPPYTPTLKEEKRLIEEREKERRRRVLSGCGSSLNSPSLLGSPSLSSGSQGSGGSGVGEGVSENKNGDGKEEGGGGGEERGPSSPSASVAPSGGSATGGETYWPMDRVESFYRECCAGCDEDPEPSVSAAFKNALTTNPRCVNLTGVQLTFASASILSDVFTIEWGLRKLLLKECDLDEVTLKLILHSLLIPGTLSYLSVASNKRMKPPAFRLVGAYLAKAKSLQFLDVSSNTLEKKSVEYLVSSLTPASEPGLVSLRMDDCNLRPAALETLCRAVRTSSLKHISLRHNKISASGAVALALMIRDYPDAVTGGAGPLSPTFGTFPNGGGTSSPSSGSTGSATGSVSSFSSFLSLTGYPIASAPSPASPSSTSTPTISPISPSLPTLFPNGPATIPTSPTTPTPNSINSVPPPPLPPPNPGPVLPPPRHPTSVPVQTTYTPYVPRAKRSSANPAGKAMHPMSSPTMPTIPIITSSSQGGVTTRHVPPTSRTAGGADGRMGGEGTGGNNGNPVAGQGRHGTGPSAALLDKVRALDSLPRLGALRTLDLKGNELRNGITYISQVLKRNRTLKVLNLSENKLDVNSLVVVAEALKYNSCLETLDLSKNPCCGPSLEGIQSLRTAFTLNTALKRLFLSGTQMNSAGAIALAEFLPESTSLLHLDLTNNVLDIAGVMALSSGLKANHVMRCLDLNIPENDDEFSRMCREILNTCIRNTEEAANAHSASSAPVYQQHHGSAARGIGKGIWGMIEDSSLARTIRLTEEKQNENDIVTKARLCVTELEYSPSPPSGSSELAQKARTLLAELTLAIQETDDSARLQDLIDVNDQLLGLLSRAPVSPVKKPVLTLQGLEGLGVLAPNGAFVPALKEDPEAAKVGDSELLNGHVATPVTVPPSSTESEPTEEAKVRNEEDDEETPSTPRVDKGKARAEPEPEEPEKILKPAFLITESSEDEDEEVPYATDVEAPGVSPTDRSRIWVAEEGEVFRKGTVLLGPEELEEEYDSEELRRELLEAMVERPPPRPITDEYGLEIAPMIPVQESEPKVNSSPPEPAKPPPKPYIPRRASLRSNSSSPLASPVVQSPGSPLAPSLSRSSGAA